MHKMVIRREGESGAQVDRYMHRKTDRCTVVQTGEQTDVKTDAQTDIKMEV
jgi:hypothetical protein